MTQYAKEVIVRDDLPTEYRNMVLLEAEEQIMRVLVSELSKTEGWLAIKMNQSSQREWMGTRFQFRLDVNKAPSIPYVFRDEPPITNYVLPSEKASFIQRLRWMLTGRI